MKTRTAGHSLLEVIAVVSVASVVLGMVSMTLHMAARGRSVAIENAQYATTVTRLAVAFRSDVHRAVSSQLPGDGALLRLRLSDQRTIDYQIEPAWIRRIVRRQDTVEHREAFALPADCRPQWESTGDDRPTVSLVLQRTAEAAGRDRWPSAVLRIDAIVGTQPPVVAAAEGEN